MANKHVLVISKQGFTRGFQAKRRIMMASQSIRGKSWCTWQSQYFGIFPKDQTLGMHGDQGDLKMDVMHCIVCANGRPMLAGDLDMNVDAL